ncbi:MAG: twin-arginine translocase TatA/TatE family subunit [Chloroherpetonaceae bacterium]|nr:twin-arginine translocase TatA/TatE family subunit [Chloroherpetonaceae bacterium]
MLHTLAMWNSPIPWVILIIVLLLFGGAKIPEMMRGLGQGMKEFKKGLNENEDDELRRERELEAEIRRRVEEELRREREKLAK